MDPGFILYDPELGWRLAPGWSGRHVSSDFDVRYRTDASGFRDGSAPSRSDARERWAVLGDSFTFGLGVADDQTFTERLNQRWPRLRAFANFAVPGYSTDQECLLLERQALGTAPAAVLVVVYLANDIVDDARPFPLQAANAKPFFALRDGRLELRNVPVPRAAKTKEQQAADSRALAFGAGRGPAVPPPLARLEVVKLVRRALGSPSLDPAAMEAELSYPLDLFARLAERIREACSRAGAPLRVALLAGRSHALEPSSPSAQYQEYVRAQVARRLAALGIPAIDLASALRARASDSLFYPRDGHLTAQGHAVAAEILAGALPPPPE